MARYVVRYGSTRVLGVFSTRFDNFRRGSKVVARTNRGMEIGEVLCASPVVRKLSFTGSTEVGRILMRQSADTIKRLSLELGGNAPFIVFDDADLDAAVEGALASKYRNAGQTCVAPDYILVHKDIRDKFIAKSKEVLKSFFGDEIGRAHV